MMYSLSDLRNFFLELGIEIKEFYGWYLKVKKDTWHLRDGKFYCNGVHVQNKEILKFYAKENTKKTWKGIHSANLED